MLQKLGAVSSASAMKSAFAPMEALAATTDERITESGAEFVIVSLVHASQHGSTQSRSLCAPVICHLGQSLTSRLARCRERRGPCGTRPRVALRINEEPALGVGMRRTAGLSSRCYANTCFRCLALAIRSSERTKPPTLRVDSQANGPACAQRHLDSQRPGTAADRADCRCSGRCTVQVSLDMSRADTRICRVVMLSTASRHLGSS